MTSGPYRAEIEAAAAAHGLDPDLVAAVVMQESNGWASAFRHEADFWEKYLKRAPLWKDRNPREVSSSYGLMQTMFPVAVEHGFTGQPWELFAPTVSLEYGCRVLAKLMAWARGLYTGLATNEEAAVRRSALAAYNGGRGGNGPNGPLRNRDYADEVLRRYHRIRGDLA
ncbi:MAG TPA: transglycosylase SLT domain-containing protein [Vicinamibacterales bacterium]|nr:transglycosylase SLT domain-containing protein [Vicinamibacterales bacterium]